MTDRRRKTRKKAAGKRAKDSRKKLYMAGGILAFLAVLYVGGAVFFSGRYLPRTQINGHKVSGKTAAQAEKVLEDDVKGYELKLTGMDNVTDVISGSDISLEYKGSAGAEKVLEEQNGFLWIISFFSKDDRTVDVGISYDEDALAERIASLNVLSGEQTPAVSAYPKYDGEKFVVEPEQYGNSVDKEALKEKIAGALASLSDSLDLEEENCYELPAYTSDSEEVKQACDTMNQYCAAKIVYSMGEEVVIDASVISGWLTVDEEMQPVIDEEAVRLWLQEFGDKYDTVGTTRTFTTPAGKAATVSGGTYGWSINEKSEYEVIVDAVKNGKTLEREPEYYIGGTAAAHAMPDWGDTYVDVDLTEQHMWYVVGGEIALETDVVTGGPDEGRITPEGTYSIQEKSEDEVLVGATDPETGEPSYETPVNYWMRVTWSGIGFHDATWQAAFGKGLNQIAGIGSHGCINMPLDKAAELYGMLEVGTPVIIHY